MAVRARARRTAGGGKRLLSRISSLDARIGLLLLVQRIPGFSECSRCISSILGASKKSAANITRRQPRVACCCAARAPQRSVSSLPSRETPMPRPRGTDSGIARSSHGWDRVWGTGENMRDERRAAPPLLPRANVRANGDWANASEGGTMATLHFRLHPGFALWACGTARDRTTLHIKQGVSVRPVVTTLKRRRPQRRSKPPPHQHNRGPGSQHRYGGSQRLSPPPRSAALLPCVARFAALRN